MSDGYNWSRPILAGLVAGLVFLVMEMMLVQFALGGSMWGPPRMIAAILMGKEVLPPPGTFDLGIVMVALGIHFVLSVIYAYIFAAIVARIPAGWALAAGAVFGLALYLINFYGFTAIWPWFANARNWVSIVSHIVYGLVLAWMINKPATARHREQTA